MFKSARAVIARGLIGGVCLAVIVGWVTGFFTSIASTVAGLWNDFMGWNNSPLGWSTSLPGPAWSSSRASCSC
ncbi:hypothetical protein [Streptomyces sp. NBC_01304]|uniref:hypothetical protein n=1 Tax=Streptomyces sp. NBC_01304 TaxID=2903818 RepID=UPI002E13498F|nr:hypothetical protein OG430_41625 [Streptomyces sp. NBC_01304]